MALLTVILFAQEQLMNFLPNINFTILLMVLEGRKPDSLGATYDDIAQIMYDYGAVNAANLDGGSSSLMYYKGEQITRGSNIIGMRQMSTAILVLN